MVKKKQATVFIYSLLFLFGLVQAVSVDLSVSSLEQTEGNHYSVVQGETFPLKITVSDRDYKTGDPRIKGLDEFIVSGQSKSTSISIINSNQSMRTEYVYDLVSRGVGEFKLGPASVMHGKKKMTSGEIVISVKKNKPGQVVRSSHQSRNSSRYSGGYELFCKLITDKKKVVVGEPIVLFVKIYTRGNILQLSLDPPKFSGFLSKKIGPVKKIREQFENKWFDVYVEQYLLYPLTSGQKKINPVKADFSVPTSRSRSPFLDDAFFSGFFGSSALQKQAFSNELILEVVDLPKYSGSVGAVGSFSKFYAHVNHNEVKINEPIVLYLDLDGEGNLEQIAVPKINLPSTFKFYESKFSTRQDPSKGYKSGSKHFEYIIQISRPGKYTISEQAFTFFDMYSRTYKTLKTDSINLVINDDPDQMAVLSSVALNEDSGDDIDSDSSYEPTYDKDINFIEEEEFGVKNSDMNLPWWLFFILFLFPLLFLDSRIISFLREKLTPIFLGKYNAQKRSIESNRKLDEIIKNKLHLDLYNFFLEFLAVKFDTSVNLVTTNLIDSRLRKLGWKPEEISKFVDYLNRCASFYFASKSSNLSENKLFDDAKYWFLILNK